MTTDKLTPRQNELISEALCSVAVELCASSSTPEVLKTLRRALVSELEAVTAETVAGQRFQVFGASTDDLLFSDLERPSSKQHDDRSFQRADRAVRKSRTTAAVLLHPRPPSAGLCPALLSRGGAFFSMGDDVSLPKPDLHIRISEDAMVALRAVTCAERGEDFPVATMAADLLEEKLLGRTHTIKVAAERMARAGFSGTDRDDR